MSAEIFYYPKPICEYQIFCHFSALTKIEKRQNPIASKADWSKPIFSENAYVQDNQLFANSAYKTELTPRVLNQALFIVNYTSQTAFHRNFYQRKENPSLQMNRGNAQPFEFDHFKHLSLRFNDNYEIWISNINQKEGESFKVVDLAENEKIYRLRYNEQCDFSSFRGEQRIFREYDVLFQFLGKFDQCIWVAPALAATTKRVQPENCKEINLRRVLN